MEKNAIERHIGNVYMVHSQERAYVLSVVSVGTMFNGPEYVVFRDAQNGQTCDGLLTPSGNTAVIRGEHESRLVVDMTSPLMNRKGQVLS